MTDEPTLAEAFAAAVGTLSLPRLLPSPGEPTRVAKAFVEDECTVEVPGEEEEGIRTLHRWHSTWMIHRGAHYAELSEEALRSWLYAYTRDAVWEKEGKDGEVFEVPWNPTSRSISMLVDALMAEVHLDDDIEDPCWLGESEVPPGTLISLRSALLHVETRKSYPHSPLFFNLSSLPYDFIEGEEVPEAWTDFLDTLWPGDPSSIALLQEWFGVVVSQDTSWHKILLMIGPTRSGKGAIARVLSALIGTRNVAGPTASSLGGTFGLEPLVNKLLGVIADMRVDRHTVPTVVERLLSISGEDRLTVDRKNRAAWAGKMTLLWMMLSNEQPKLVDASGAIVGRMLILRLTESFLGREDRELEARLHEGLPGLLNWSLDGLDRLRSTGSFTVPAYTADEAEEMAELGSAVKAWATECCITGSTAMRTFSSSLFESWTWWARENGHQIGSQSTFGRNLRAAVPSVRRYRARMPDGSRPWAFEGIALRPSSF